ncbi:MAG: hypothetical protein JW782_03405 [Candidatus Saganbacteria bacterium]|nr:hypothetical protein [Candidatus Saganbacteria bacterium]
MAKARELKLPRSKVKIFKMRNRAGYAALYQNNLTEGRTPNVAYERMLKAVRRRPKKR